MTNEEREDAIRFFNLVAKKERDNAKYYSKLAIEALEQQSCEDVPDTNDGNIYKCSCGYGRDKSKVFRHHFCPNCGKPVDSSIKTELESREDCISRRYLLNNCVVDKVTMPYVPVNKIENAPPVASQQKIGRWINGNSICPCCGEDKFKDLDADIWADWQPKFCPNCGTRMKKAEDEISE